MSDWTRSPVLEPIGATIHQSHPTAGTCQIALSQNTSLGQSAWPAANRAIFVPFVVSETISVLTARQMFWENGVVAGTTDAGIYDIAGKLITSSGPQTNVGTIQVVNVTATVLPAGAYYMALAASTVTTQTYTTWGVSLPSLRACGMAQATLGSATLPASVTFAALVSNILPLVGINFRLTM